MSQVNQAGYLAASTYQTNQTYSNSKVENTKNNTKAEKESDTTKEADNSKLVKGMKTYGDAKLSDKALEYYKSLTKKYNNLNFVLVASDKKEQAQLNKASFATVGRLTVLVDTDKIERMANDEDYRKQIESVIEKGASSMANLTSNMNQNSNSSTGTSKVTAYGMSINNDGTASYFAVLSKSTAAQKERIEKKAAQKKEDKKAQDKKADKKEEQEEALQRIKDRKEDNAVSTDEDITITANSIEELMKKIQEYQMNERTNLVQTDTEKSIGQGFDCTI